MIRIVTAKRLEKMAAEREWLREKLAAVQEAHRHAGDREFAAARERGREHAAAQREIGALRWELNVAESAANRLRAEVAELVEEVAAADTALGGAR
ncbi:hypothetical protein DTL70_21095 [Streptomyces diacarni]|uniref:Uncharacterized protein n=1 Tax=Streptomyces diacarni TaxID=2800381 RepID=A0A367ES31_9ACTN|nr:hypothetical protein [Streptomyces diacarni]RCG20773.1 hypothetical protein DTL70_21095 [Streptomyces diacarni]